MNKLNGTAALILAAGISKRMGLTKQLLHLGEMPLLERVIRQVVLFPFCEIVCVVGHHAKQIRTDISIFDERFRWSVNTNYEKGQGSSLKKGMGTIHSDHVMVFLGDQPFIANDTIRSIFEEGERRGRERRRPFVVRPAFQSVPGHPVFFGNVTQIDFSTLIGDQGAKHLIKRIDDNDVIPVDDDGVIFDIDTPESYEEAKRKWDQSHHRFDE